MQKDPLTSLRRPVIKIPSFKLVTISQVETPTTNETQIETSPTSQGEVERLTFDSVRTHIKRKNSDIKGRNLIEFESEPGHFKLAGIKIIDKSIAKNTNNDESTVFQSTCIDDGSGHNQRDKAPTMDNFTEFLTEVCDIDPTKVPDIDILFNQCFREIKKYCKRDDTTQREDLMEAISSNLLGMNWPTYADDATEFNEKLAKYKVDRSCSKH